MPRSFHLAYNFFQVRENCQWFFMEGLDVIAYNETPLRNVCNIFCSFSFRILAVIDGLHAVVETIPPWKILQSSNLVLTTAGGIQDRWKYTTCLSESEFCNPVWCNSPCKEYVPESLTILYFICRLTLLYVKEDYRTKRFMVYTDFKNTYFIVAWPVCRSQILPCMYMPLLLTCNVSSLSRIAITALEKLQ